jgi:diacylglycerol kinase (ATP)
MHVDFMYRWKVTFTADSEPSKEYIMNNYMSIGVDAEIALQFHTLRNKQPELFTSQFINKFWYAQYGLRSMFNEMERISSIMDLEVVLKHFSKW